MIDHLENCTFDTGPIEREDTERHKAHVADTREGDKPLDVRLDQSHVRTPNNCHRGYDEHGLQEELHAMWKYRERHAQKTVRAHLEKDTRQNHASRCWGLRVCVGEPGMHWKHWDLNREGSQKGREEPCLLCRLKACSGNCQRFEIQRAAGAVYNDDAHKHQHAAGQREDQKLDRGVDSPRTSPHTDEEKNRNEHELPENKKEKKIRCCKQPDHRRLRDHQRRIEFPYSRLDRSP